MKTAKLDSYLLVGACAPRAQDKLFKKLIRTTGFNDKHFVLTDIRAPIIKRIVDRLRNAAKEILKSKEATPTTTRESRIGNEQAQRHQIPSHAPVWQKRMIMTVDDVSAWFVLVFGRVVEARVALGIRL